MRIALAQINPIVGDFEHNANQIIEFTKRAAEKRAHLAVFPEMALFGYPANDLLEREEKIKEQLRYVQKILKTIPKDITIVFGAVKPNEKRKSKGGKPFHNVAIVGRRGAKPAIFAKQLLPSYDVFDETRFFEPGHETGIVNIPNIGRVAISVCEDMWAVHPDRRNYDKDPLAKIKGVKLIVNISASPFAQGKHKTRLSLAKSHATKHRVPFVYVNQVGGQDEVVFDGQSFLINQKGKLLVQAAAWHEDLVMLDLEKNVSEYRPTITDPMEHVRQGIIVGIRDFVEKTGNKKVHLGLSGGIDSAIVAALAVDALGPNQVTGFILPTSFNSSASIEDAETLAKNLGIQVHTIKIDEAFTLISKMSEVFGLQFDPKAVGIPHQNIQARLRGLLMMTYANHTGSLLLATGNKSELASGYCTLYGDMCGALVPLGDIVKGQVYELANLYNKNAEIIPARSISRPPSAELAPDQRDQDTLPPYDTLDSAVRNLIELKTVPKTETEKWLYKILGKSEFKRWQAPPIIRLTEHAFGRGRRLPIAAKL